MINFETLFKNHFDSDKVSDDKLKLFTEDHLHRLAVNNDSGMVSVILNETQTTHFNYFGEITDEATNIALRKSHTLGVDNIIATFKEEVSRREGLIKSLFGKDSPTYLEFYPQGVTEYSKGNKANIETLINRMVKIANIHVAAIGNDFVNIFAAIQANFIAARSAQLDKKSEVSANKAHASTLRNVVELQLIKNIHYIGFLYPADVKRCVSFFDQSIVHYNQSATSDGLGRLKGIITNSTGKEPLADAEIEVMGARINKAHTDVAGKYRTHNLRIGTYEIKITKQGFNVVNISKEIIDNEDTELNVELISQ